MYNGSRCSSSDAGLLNFVTGSQFIIKFVNINVQWVLFRWTAQINELYATKIRGTSLEFSLKRTVKL
jgi:hypothetical protein